MEGVPANGLSIIPDLRNNQDFCDVTLACDDDQQIEAH